MTTSSKFKAALENEINRLVSEKNPIDIEGDEFLKLLKVEVKDLKSCLSYDYNLPVNQRKLRICVHNTDYNDIETFIDIEELVKLEIDLYEEDKQDFPDSNLNDLIDYFTNITELLKKHNGK